MPEIEFITSAVADPASAVMVELVEEGALRSPLASLNGASLEDFSSAGLGFNAKAATTLLIPLAGSSPVIAVGMAAGTEDADELRKVGAAIAGSAKGFDSASIVIPAYLENLGPMSLRYLTEGIVLAGYGFDKYHTDEEALAAGSKLARVTYVVTAPEEIGAAEEISRGVTVAQATCLARDMVNEPASVMTPAAFAERAGELVAGHPELSIEVWDEARIKSERLGGLMGVARGSAQPPRMVKLTYQPKVRAEKTVALVGKGITFDSGGLSLKPADGMTTMKTDMSGAAAVLSAMLALPALEVPVKVVGFMMLTENMPGGSATKPGDVVVTRAGKTIEVLNTDAEGRLVLADGLALATEQSPDYIVDIATLTGACVVALGREIAGVFANSQELVTDLSFAGDVAGEQLWQLPLPERYRKHIRSEVADMKNMGEPGQAGAIAGAMLLAQFVGNIPWAHLDIAGPSRSSSAEGYLPVGGTGFGARLLCYFLEEFGE
ncbi:MAG: leucyl aminopeptidase [Actinomycetota bacterium]|nr:leucyl aminopeptidase [Actinomycetota bacterium]